MLNNKKFHEAVRMVDGANKILQLMEVALYHAESLAGDIDFTDIGVACEFLYKTLNGAAEELMNAELYIKKER